MSLDQEVRRRRDRRERWEREGHRSAGYYLGMVGSIGWSIVLPILGGIALGRWLDHKMDAGITWTAALLMVGAGIGMWVAWRQVRET